MRLNWLAIMNSLQTDHNKFINSLRCPLCGSQLDGNLFSNIYCVAANNEYVAWYRAGDKIPHIEHIMITFEDIKKQYYIYYSEIVGTIIYELDLQFPEKYKYENKIKILEIKNIRLSKLLKLDQLKLNQKEFLEKISIYQTFS